MLIPSQADNPPIIKALKALIKRKSIDMLCNFIIDKIKSLFSEGQYFESICKCLGLLPKVLTAREDYFWFKSMHLLQNYCETLDPNQKPQII